MQELILSHLPLIIGAAINYGVTTTQRFLGVTVNPQAIAILYSLLGALGVYIFYSFVDPALQESFLREASEIFAIQLVIYEVLIGKRSLFRK